MNDKIKVLLVGSDGAKGTAIFRVLKENKGIEIEHKEASEIIQPNSITSIMLDSFTIWPPQILIKENKRTKKMPYYRKFEKKGY